jgi:hypothetical protein
MKSTGRLVVLYHIVLCLPHNDEKGPKGALKHLYIMIHTSTRVRV